MKIISYVGSEGDTIVIQRPQDLIPLLDWFHSQLMDRGARDEDVNYVNKLMDKVEADGYSSYEDIDNIEY
jgi:hypothetical protein